MALLGFQDRFVDKVRAGEKRHTIRAMRARVIRAGEMLHLYEKPRQKGMRLIFRAPCSRIQRITIGGAYFELPALVCVDGTPLDKSECEQLARRDVFADYTEFVAFWSDRRPFEGMIIHWNYDRRVTQ